MDFAASRRSRLVLFGALYFAQGLPWGFLAVTLNIYLTRLGHDAKTVGSVVSLCYWPWVLKPVLGPLSDRLDLGARGRRRPWLLAAQIGMAGTLLVLAGIDPRTALPAFLAVLFVNNLFGAAQDVGTDALAIEILPESERGRAQGVMWGSKWAGVLAGSTGLSHLSTTVGFRGLFPIMAVTVLAVSVFPLLLREPPRPPGRETMVRAVVRAFARREALLGIGLMLVAQAGTSLVVPVSFGFLLNDLKYDEEAVGNMVLVSGVGSVIGALAGGLLSDRLGRGRAIFVATIASALPLCGWAAVAASPEQGPAVWALNAADGLAQGLIETTLLALCMDLTDPAVGGTQFTIFMAATNLKNAWATRLGGELSAHLSVPAMYGTAAAVQVLPLLLLPLLFVRARSGGGRRALRDSP